MYAVETHKCSQQQRLHLPCSMSPERRLFGFDSEARLVRADTLLFCSYHHNTTFSTAMTDWQPSLPHHHLLILDTHWRLLVCLLDRMFNAMGLMISSVNTFVTDF